MNVGSIALLRTSQEGRIEEVRKQEQIAGAGCSWYLLLLPDLF
jgi:hypothetical protein